MNQRSLPLLVALGLAGCDVCIGDCIDDAGDASSDDGGQSTTTGLGMTSTSAATSGAEPPGETPDTWGESYDDDGGTSGQVPDGETEGLDCEGMGMPPDVVDMRSVRAGDMVPPPAEYSADTRFLVLRSQGSVCGPDPLAPPDCNESFEFTLVVVIPPEFQAVGSYDFGEAEAETGSGEPDLVSWIHIGGDGSCGEVGTTPNDATLEIEAIDADGSITGRICSFDYMAQLGQGLSGYIDAAAC